MEKLRKKIVNVDKKIISLIGKRMKIVRDIGKIKKAAQMPIQDKKREELLRSMYCDIAGEYGLSPEFINKLLDAIFEEGRKVQGEL